MTCSHPRKCTLVLLSTSRHCNLDVVYIHGNLDIIYYYARAHHLTKTPTCSCTVDVTAEASTGESTSRMNASATAALALASSSSRRLARNCCRQLWRHCGGCTEKQSSTIFSASEHTSDDSCEQERSCKACTWPCAQLVFGSKATVMFSKANIDHVAGPVQHFTARAAHTHMGAHLDLSSRH